MRTGRAALAFEQQPRERSLRTATRALPFEQQPKESDKAFAAFAVYLGMGPGRALSLVASQSASAGYSARNAQNAAAAAAASSTGIWP